MGLSTQTVLHNMVTDKAISMNLSTKHWEVKQTISNFLYVVNIDNFIKIVHE